MTEQIMGVVIGSVMVHALIVSLSYNVPFKTYSTMVLLFSLYFVIVSNEPQHIMWYIFFMVVATTINSIKEMLDRK